MDLKDLKIKKLLEKLTGQKNLSKFAVVLGFSGILLIFASSVFPKSCKNFEAKGNFKVATEQKREKLEKNSSWVRLQTSGKANRRHKSVSPFLF